MNSTADTLSRFPVGGKEHFEVLQVSGGKGWLLLARSMMEEYDAFGMEESRPLEEELWRELG